VKEIGFPVSRRENELRRAILPEDLERIEHPECCFFEKGFGDPLGIDDRAYVERGASIAERANVLQREVICNPKALDPDMIGLLKSGQTLFGWLHAVQGVEITDILVDHGMTGIAWEDMYEGQVHVFWRNNEIAGEAAVVHAARFSGKAPYEWNVALLGRGNCARGAWRILEKLGAAVMLYPKERMFQLKNHIEAYDVVVNALHWDVFDKRLVLSRDDVRRMRQGSMIVDIACDAEGMCIETSHPTTIADPIFIDEGVIHYAVDHTPAIFYFTASVAISRAISTYINAIINEEANEVLENATVIRDGEIIDAKIKKFQNR
jgi:N5-(carboxyethyl)ornithine synthase